MDRIVFHFAFRLVEETKNMMEGDLSILEAGMVDSLIHEVRMINSPRLYI
jgi:hypothetical protein